jgi:hypothetical protein
VPQAREKPVQRLRRCNLAQAIAKSEGYGAKTTPASSSAELSGRCFFLLVVFSVTEAGGHPWRIVQHFLNSLRVDDAPLLSRDGHNSEANLYATSASVRSGNSDDSGPIVILCERIQRAPSVCLYIASSLLLNFTQPTVTIVKSRRNPL